MKWERQFCRLITFVSLPEKFKSILSNLELSFFIGLFNRIIAARERGGKSEPAWKKNATHRGSPIVRTLVLIKKVARDVKTPNPPSQRHLSRKQGIAKGTISAILKKDSGLNFKTKVRTYVLFSHRAEQRLKQGPRSLRWSVLVSSPFFLTFDQTYLSMNDMDGQMKGLLWVQGEFSAWKLEIVGLVLSIPPRSTTNPTITG